MIRDIFDSYLKGSSLAEIARELMRRGIKTTRNGEVWHSGSVKKILENITYTGNKLAGISTKDLLTKSDIPRNQYFIEKSHPAIIDMDTFKKINDIPFYEYIFTRLIEKGIIYGDGKIIFVFKCGLEWSIPLRYEEYIVESHKARVEANITKRLQSDEVKGLLEFCRKPRTKAEMLEFSSYKFMSGIERSVIKPLMEEGKLKRKRDENYRFLQYLYYTVR